MTAIGCRSVSGLLAGAAMSLTRHVLADGVSDAEAESKTDQKDNCEIHRATLFKQNGPHDLRRTTRLRFPALRGPSGKE